MKRDNRVECYRSVAAELVAVENGCAVLRRAHDGICVRAPASCVALLPSCKAFRTLEEHAHHIVSSTVSAGKGFDSVVQELVETQGLGLLLSLSELQEHCEARGSDSSDTAEISTVAVPTRNRPDLALRCIDSVVAHATRHAREIEIVVMDDSDDNRLLSSLSDRDKTSGITLRYGNRAMRAGFVEALARKSGAPKEVCEFALLDPFGLKSCLGANRNSVALDLAGSTVLTLDDDVICRAGRTSRYREGVALMSRPDPTEFEMYPDTASAVQAVQWRDDDFFIDHERWLGTDLGSRLAQDHTELHAGEVDDALIMQLVRHGASPRATMTGVAGDSGTNIPYQFLATGGASHDAVVANERAYHLARTGRSVVRAADRVTFSNHPFLMPTGTGMDLRAPLPPFTPVMRRSDALFAYLLYLCFPGTGIAHLPMVMEHDPVPPRPTLKPDAFYFPRRPFFSELVTYAVGAGEEYLSATGDPRERLMHLGDQARRVAAMPPDRFKAFMVERVRARISKMSREVETMLARFPGSPRFWIEDMERMIERFEDDMRADDVHLPFDLPGDVRSEQPLQLARTLIDRFGAVLSHWPAMFDAAQYLGRRGHRISEALQHRASGPGPASSRHPDRK